MPAVPGGSWAGGCGESHGAWMRHRFIHAPCGYHPRMAHAQPQTVSAVVREAAGIVDPADELALVGDFERWFEEDDEPVTAAAGLERKVGGAVAEIDPEGTDGPLAVAAAVVLYLGTSPCHEPCDSDRIVDQAVKYVYGDSLPEPVAGFLG